MASGCSHTDNSGASETIVRRGHRLTAKALLAAMFLFLISPPWLAPVWAQAAQRGLSTTDLVRATGIAAAVVAIVLLISAEFLLRKKLQRSTYYLLLLIGLFILPGFALLNTTTLLFEETKTVSSCGSCHVMQPFVSDLQSAQSTTLAAKHYTHKWIADNQCYTCHTTYGLHGTLEAKIAGLRHWLLYVTRSWNEPIRHRGPYPNSNCLFCHRGTPKYEAQSIHHVIAAHLANDTVGCVSCHGPAHPPPDQRAISN